MKAAVTVARTLLALIFIAAGVSGFLLIQNPPPAPPGLAGAFQDVYFRSHWVVFVDGVELIAGILLLANRFVPLALVVLAAVITNMFIFHITMMPLGLPAPLVLTVLWVIVAWPLRSYLVPLLVQRPSYQFGDIAILETGRTT
mgnify:CR=1 FL=1